MDLDLQRALHDLGDDPAARGTALPVDLLVRRAHRRRVARATTYSAVGTGAAAALVVGGVALTDDRQPTPAPAAPSPSRSAAPEARPTPTSSATPTSTPTPTFDPAWDLCGAELRDAWPVGTTDDSWWAQAVGDGPERVVLADVGAPVTATLELVRADAVTEVVTASVARTVVTAFDEGTGSDVVVAVGGSPVDLTAHGTVSANAMLDLGTLTTTFATCATSPTVGGDGTGRLAEGMYALVVETLLTHADGTTTTTLTTGNLAVGEPDELAYYGADDGAEQQEPGTVTGDPSDLAPLRYRVESIGVPGCGAAWFPSVPPATWWTISGPVGLIGSYVEGELTATGTGLDIPDGAALEPLVTVTRDGVVVAQTPDEARTPLALVGWTTGSTLRRHVSLPTAACGDVAGVRAGEWLPAGEYQVWVMQGVLRDRSQGAGVNLMYAGPWALTLP